MKTTRTLKIIIGVIIFFTLPSLLFFGFIYIRYHEDLPYGQQGVEADALAHSMLDALDYEAYKNTEYIEWTFKNKQHYKWNKAENSCLVYWKDYKVDLNVNTPHLSKAYVHNFKVTGEQAEELITKAQNHFNNDSFWLVAPYKVFDTGVERRLVTLENGSNALLVTYTEGGTTPGDSYLWYLDDNGKPTKFKMWVEILPIGGLEASWNDWTTTESGAQLPTYHEMIFLGIQMGNVIGTNAN